MLTTKIDEMVGLIRKGGRVTFREISKKLSWQEEYVEKVALMLEKAGLARTHYPVDMVRQPWATIVELPEEREGKAPEEGKAIESYEVKGRWQSEAKVTISESEEEHRPTYRIVLARVSPYTRAYLEYVKVESAKALSLDLLEKGVEESERQYDARYKAIAERIRRDISPDPASLESLAEVVVNEMFGLGDLEALLIDQKLEEIIINSSTVPVSVYHKKYGWLRTNVLIRSEADTENYAAQIARKVGRQISTLSPVLDARLATGDRANATLYPISAHGNTLTLRLFSKNPWTVVTFLKKDVNTMTAEMAAMLWQAVQYELNVIIAGGTASGKTSALNGLVSLVQPYQRIVTIEDTRELSLPSYQWNWVPLVTRAPNPEGLGEVSMLDLVVNSLRMRPDRIVMGEIRRKREAEVLFEAMHTGHSVYSTLHADTGAQVIKRLTEPPIEIPPSEVEDIHLLLVQYRDRRKNLRRTLELSEITPGAGKPEINHIYVWKARNDTFEMVRPPHRYSEQMNLHTGMTEKEIMDDQKDKSVILRWMLKNGLDGTEDVGKVMKSYYSDAATILKSAEKGEAPSKVL